MDYQFPQQLFPAFYNCGPPDSVLTHSAGSWGGYERVLPQRGSSPSSGWTFKPRHRIRAETWRQTEPIPVPLMSPKHSLLWPSTPPDPLDFTEHMQNFFIDHSFDAFGCMSEILGENVNFQVLKKTHQDSDKGVKKFLDMTDLKKCQRSYCSQSLDAYSALLSDVVHGIPHQLLGNLLYEELMEQRDRLLFSERATGGALAFIPFSQRNSSSQQGCLLYPGNQGLNCLNFHRVELQQNRGSPASVDASSCTPVCFQLKGPIRQISSASLLNNSCVAVRSDHLCGVWKFSEVHDPHLLQVIDTREVATCVSVSPHVLGEVLVVSESGAANLWTVGRGIQKVREENQNLYFNAKSPWRWCEFSAHPRVMLYADRTGVELTDIRVSTTSGHTLFRISNTSECRNGERLVLSRYLGDVHSFHHLITTQYSAYIMDERFPGMPVLKVDHMMQSPPTFCHVISDSTSAAHGPTKVLLGSQASQEITLLQYSGGRAEACYSQGPPQALLRPKDSVKHLPVQIPHRLDITTNRLSSPAAGLTCIQKKGGKEAGDEECICVLQLTESGDLFYQVLEPPQPDNSTPTLEGELQPHQAASQLNVTTLTGGETADHPQPHSQLHIPDTSSDEGIIEPTQYPNAQKLIPETPEREQVSNMFSDSSSDDELRKAKSRYLKQMLLQVVINDDPEPDQVNGLDNDNNVEEVANTEEQVTETFTTLNPVAPKECQTPLKLSDNALATWKHWLTKLMQRSRKKKPRQNHLQPPTTPHKHLLDLSGNKERDPAEEERIRSLRRDMRASMSKRSLLVHSTLSTPDTAQDFIPVPDLVDTEVWTDQLSQRLTLSWQGEGAWRSWWEDQLGLNREKKVDALRRKRRKEKEARRAAGQHIELSGSFTSGSCLSQSELDDFSCSTGWSSAASQGAWSDVEQTQSVGFWEPTSRAETPSSPKPDTQVTSPMATPQRVKDKEGDHQTPSTSRTLSLSQTLMTQEATTTSQRSIKRPAKDYLSSLFESQAEPSHPQCAFTEDGTMHSSPPPVASPVKPRSSLSVSQRSLRTDLSQDVPVWSGFSPSRPLSQSSQGRLGLSQASQNKKKKSRMGF